jgi:hypothetical protein
MPSSDQSSIPDLKEWEVHCDNCEAYRLVRRAKLRDEVTGPEIPRLREQCCPGGVGSRANRACTGALSL